MYITYDNLRTALHKMKAAGSRIKHTMLKCGTCHAARFTEGPLKLSEWSPSQPFHVHVAQGSGAATEVWPASRWSLTHRPTYVQQHTPFRLSYRHFNALCASLCITTHL